MALIPVKMHATVDHLNVGEHVELPEAQALNLIALGLAERAEPLDGAALEAEVLDEVPEVPVLGDDAEMAAAHESDEAPAVKGKPAA